MIILCKFLSGFIQPENKWSIVPVTLLRIHFRYKHKHLHYYRSGSSLTHSRFIQIHYHIYWQHTFVTQFTTHTFISHHKFTTYIHRIHTYSFIPHAFTAHTFIPHTHTHLHHNHTHWQHTHLYYTYTFTTNNFINMYIQHNSWAQTKSVYMYWIIIFVKPSTVNSQWFIDHLLTTTYKKRNHMYNSIQ